MMMRMPRPATALAGTILLAACSTAASPTATESENATPSPTVAATASPSPVETRDPAATQDESAQEGWTATATQYRGMNGQQFAFQCPAGGVLRPVWGTDVYTDDSSVCTAAVHAGVITLEDPKTVTIEIRPGESEYEGSERNRVTSLSYPAWPGSFVIIDD